MPKSFESTKMQLAVWILSIAILSFIPGRRGQSVGKVVTLEDNNHTQSMSSCQGGLIDGIDKLLFFGFVNTTGVDTSSRQKVYFQKKAATDVTFFEVCSITISDMCSSTSKQQECYCQTYSENFLRIIVNLTADVLISKNLGRLRWPGLTPGTDDVSEARNIPEIFNKEVESFTLNNDIVKKEDLSIQVTLNNNYTFKYCVQNLQEGTVTITYKNVANNSASGCVYYSFTTAIDDKDEQLITQFVEMQGCKRHNSFTWTLKDTVTTTSTIVTTNAPETVTLTSTTAPTTIPETVTSTSTTLTTSATVKPPSSVDNTDTIVGVVVGVGSCLLIAGIIIAVLIYKKEKPKCSDSKIILVIVVTVAGSVVIVGIVIGLLFYCNVCKFKKANKQPTGLTLTETTPTTNVPPARHIETKRPLPPLAHLPPHKISPDISGNNEKASNISGKTSNETPNDSQRKKKTKKKRARRNLENGGKNDEQ